MSLCLARRCSVATSAWKMCHRLRAQNEEDADVGLRFPMPKVRSDLKKRRCSGFGKNIERMAAACLGLSRIDCTARGLQTRGWWQRGDTAKEPLMRGQRLRDKETWCLRLRGVRPIPFRSASTRMDRLPVAMSQPPIRLPERGKRLFSKKMNTAKKDTL